MQAPLPGSNMGVDAKAPKPYGGGRRPELAGFDTSGLPHNFVQRLVADSQGGDEYRRIDNINQIETIAPNSSYWGVACAGCCCSEGALVEQGQLGVVTDNGAFGFLAPGYHTVSSYGSELGQPVSIRTVDRAVTHGTVGFVTVSEAKVGLLLVGSSYKLLAPGTYQWTSPRVQFQTVTSVTDQIVQLGPYTLVTVPRGEVAVTFNNGELIVLGYEEQVLNMGDNREPSHVDAPKRTYFLENAKWRLACFLPTVVQTDRLEGNDLLSKDNVEVLMVAMSQWRIVDPVRAVNNCASSMDQIRTKVNQLVRATIARIVAGTNIGAGPVSGASGRPVVAAVAVDGAECAPAAQQKPKDDADLAHLMKSEMASKHMAELTTQMEDMGIEVIGVYVPEKRMKNDDIRKEVAKQAVIGIKAEAERAAADAKAYATVKAARAEAEAIEMLAAAHADAGSRLGAPETTASRLALSETMTKALKDANLTVFSGAPDSMPFMFGAPPAGGNARAITRA
eukprot:CAMPEP_0174842406 /NCGR_PEP_ID=MMETSP1114-20130205/9889_1 /TAXON_ID=312471 /ORGANISM="Neobodo designis, Strain CCAP 1951/1" /LENGTH=506 /DNA_ID=CAMNT_0016076609 /DNA_START=74 /DNA_END=1594 /DNA_ORIENTATION=-